MKAAGGIPLRSVMIVVPVLLVIAGVLALAAQPGSRMPTGRTFRNHMAADRLIRAMHEWDRADHLPDQLGDLVAAGLLDKVPLFESQDGALNPFVYAGGVAIGDNHQLVLLVAPVADPDGKVQAVSFDEFVERLSPAAAAAALETTRARIRRQRSAAREARH